MDTSGNMHPYKFVVFVNIFLLFGATSRAQQLPRPQDIDLDLINAKSLSPSGVKVNVADDIKLASSLHADCSNVDVGDFTSPGLDIIFPVMAKKDAILPLSTFNNATQSHRRHVVVRFTFRGERHKLKLQPIVKSMKVNIAKGFVYNYVAVMLK
ncbi:hypothetical protein EB796_004997 [Bugula neritina]|uniref:Uncharacterized protein n=1 Tax=Bugula neritina TaxID=10212 RepID=A0A7J7KFN2_BUGNE|nr:hypothetical protein EB796_004997 [Bugula neritina]